MSDVKKTVSIVIPVYFNEGSLPTLFQEIVRIEQQMAEKNLQLELIFVDDGSGDGSLKELLRIKDARPATKVIKLTRNFGSVHAYKAGLQFVTGDCFMIFTADLQDPPQLIMQMIDKWCAGSKYTICSRISREDPMTSKVFAAIYYWLLRHLVIKDYPKGGYDLALMDKEFLSYLLKSSKHAYTQLLIYWLGYKYEIIYYHRAKRLYGKSRWTFAKKVKVLLDVMLGFSVKPIRIISGIGAAVALMSFIYGIMVIVSALTRGNPVPGFTTIAALISFLLGLIILTLGIIGEYLWRIFDETNHRPETVIEKVY